MCLKSVCVFVFIGVCFFIGVLKIGVFTISVFLTALLTTPPKKNKNSVRLINYVFVRDRGVLTAQVCRSRLEPSNGGVKPILALVRCSFVPGERPR